MKKFFKYLGIALALLILVLGIAFMIYNEPLPKGEDGPKAALLRSRMANAINFDAWKNSDFVHWKFEDAHEYWWDRRTEIVKVNWANIEVYFHTPSQEGVALVDGERVDEKRNTKLISKAVGFFNNDSFWLNGPAKCLEAGSSFAAVEQDGETGLLITFEEGGSTPGDSFMWILDDSGLPKACKMWVSVSPLGGMRTTIAKWEQLETGAMIPTRHTIGPMTISINDLSSAQMPVPQKIRGNNIFDELDQH